MTETVKPNRSTSFPAINARPETVLADAGYCNERREGVIQGADGRRQKYCR